MSKPIEPKPDDSIERWLKYYVRYNKYIIRKRAMSKRYRQKYPEKHKARRMRWWLRYGTEYGREYRRKYFSKPENRQKELERLYAYIERNPFCNITKMEKLIKIYERTVSLDEQIGEDLTRYDLIAV